MKHILTLAAVTFSLAMLSAQQATIPVVVHVLWHNATENLSNGRIAAQIASLNLDYRKQNTDISEVPLAFAALAADTDIEFCLATIGPDGQPTDGILHQFVSDPDIGGTFNSTKDVYYTAQGGSDAWPADQYVNIWVANMPDGVEGFATLPISSQPPTEWGLVIDPAMFGTGPDNPDGRGGGRTLTHEMGHYLGLQHPWGAGSGCDSDDLVTDTPVQDGPYFGCPGFPTSSCGSTDLTQNFMQYTDDACRVMFTAGQKTVMWQTLENLRPGLLSSGGCSTPTSMPPTAIKLVCFPSPAHDILTVVLAAAVTGRVHVFDARGSSMFSEAVPEAATALHLSIGDWPIGVYYVRLFGQDGSLGHTSFVKM